MRLIKTSLIALILTANINAQSPNIASYTWEVFAPGVSPVTGSPISVTNFQALNASCNQAPPTIPANVVNPVAIIFDDAANFGRVCIINIPSNTLVALPNQPGYLSTLSQTDTIGQLSARSAASNPFARQSVPLTITNVKVK